MNIIKPIEIDIYNIRNERQKINNEIAMKRIKERNFNKDINNEEYKRILLELSKYNKTEKELLDECNDNIILLIILASRISINASRQGVKDELLQIDTCNITCNKFDISMDKLTVNSYRPTKDGLILNNNDIKKNKISLNDCLKSFDAKLNGKINGWVFAKIVIGNGGHQDNVFEEAYILCEWIIKYSIISDLFIILIDTNLINKFNDLKKKFNNIENLIIGNHIEIQQYFIDKYNHD
jgi:hypothetical protein